MKISIIIPVYNAEHTILRCVDSVLAQSHRDFECILINDGSTDNSGIICDEYARKDSRIKVFHKTNGGVSSARNYGLNNASGEWIVFVDSDDKIDRDFLSLLDLNSNYDLIIGGYKILPKGHSLYDFSEEYNQNTMVVFLSRHLKNGYVWGKFYKTSIIKENNILFRIDLSVYEDLIFNLEYLLYCNNIKLIPDCLYYYYDLKEKIIFEKYALNKDKIKTLYQLVDRSLKALSAHFYCESPNYVFEFIDHYPLKRIIDLGNDDEMYQLYTSVRGNISKKEFYQNPLISPIFRFLIQIRKEYYDRKRNDVGLELIRTLKKIYGKNLLYVKYPTFGKRIQGFVIYMKWFKVIDSYYRWRSSKRK